ncbi:hypothetical protein EYF80_048014 [Liparis tanakae]|uniref:Uncharacterized protein n=1 Tax=Liparis tanakae TaxID=230148 RepID=A0A4Z2FKR2_9TELE|nr:hypothetical protein EYF80_048014 [Liparis tanakae]
MQRATPVQTIQQQPAEEDTQQQQHTEVDVMSSENMTTTQRNARVRRRFSRMTSLPPTGAKERRREGQKERI